ncbi:hypothetical protein VUN82_10555 [Micrococcaceae bacterium Sec5.1]
MGPATPAYSVIGRWPQLAQACTDHESSANTPIAEGSGKIWKYCALCQLSRLKNFWKNLEDFKVDLLAALRHIVPGVQEVHELVQFGGLSQGEPAALLH